MRFWSKGALLYSVLGLGHTLRSQSLLLCRLPKNLNRGKNVQKKSRFWVLRVEHSRGSNSSRKGKGSNVHRMFAPTTFWLREGTCTCSRPYLPDASDTESPTPCNSRTCLISYFRILILSCATRRPLERSASARAHRHARLGSMRRREAAGRTCQRLEKGF